MGLDYLANVADIVGGILIIATLAFLAMQIRQNTRAIQATAIQSAMQSEMEFASILLGDAEVWEKVVSGAPLTRGVESRKAILLFNVFMTDTESRYFQYNAGHLDAQAWDGRLSTMADAVKFPVFRLWRHSLGGLSHSAGFLKLLDDLVPEGSDNSSDQ